MISLQRFEDEDLLLFSGPLSVRFFLFFHVRTTTFQFLSFSQYALCLCAHQHVSLSASRCLRQAFLNRKKAAEASVLFTLLQPCVCPFAGLCPF